MNSKRINYLLMGGLALVLVLGGGGLFLSNYLLKQSADQLNDYKLQTEVLYQQQVQLAQAKQDIIKYEDLEKIAKTIVPQEKDQASTVREIIRLAEETGVPVNQITFPTSDLGKEDPKKKTTTTTNDTQSGSSSAAPAPEAARAAPPPSQLKAVKELPGVYQLDINVSGGDALASFDDLINFIDRLEQNRRTSLITGINIRPDTNLRSRVTYDLTISVYIKP